MQNLESKVELVAACGLYCGACRAFRAGRCPGCGHNIKATWCKVRTCNHAQGYSSCAECKDFSDPMQCKKFNSPLSKVFGFLFRSDRAACIAQIKQRGLEGHVAIMAASGRPGLPRK